MTNSPPVQVTFARSDEGNARLLAHMTNGNMVYDKLRNTWFHWQKGQWVGDNDLAVRLVVQSTKIRVQAIANAPANEWGKEGQWANHSQNHSAIMSCLDMAKTIPEMQSSGWNQDPMLLGLRNGVVNLRSGNFRAAAKGDYITAQAGLNYVMNAQCPRWERFLVEVFKDNPELIPFIKRAVGYSLTGLTSEQVFFYLFGSGSNGKSKFLTILRHLMGEYSSAVSFATFEARSGDRIPNDLAALMGKRVVLTSEPGQRARWNEAQLKAITGGETIAARFMRAEWFEYLPSYKIWMSANHQVQTTDYSDGFWRRVVIVPFNQKFSPGDEPDLEYKLIAELPGILNWAIEGCLEWQQNGLGTPGLVREAVQEYKEQEREGSWGGMYSFLEARTVVDPGGKVPCGDMYLEYKHWAEGNLLQKEVLTNTQFGRQMTALQFGRTRTPTNRFYTGVQLVPEGISVSAPARG